MNISNLFAIGLTAGALWVVGLVSWSGGTLPRYVALVALLLGLGVVLWSRRAKSFGWQKPAALVLGLLFAFVLGEVIVRLSETSWANRVPGIRMGTDEASMFEPDPALGYVPRSHNWTYRWNRDVTTLEDGVRSNGRPIVEDPERTILVVGDSFAFGDEVGDDETWPAQLESLLNETRPRTRVVNAGVSGYGLDQMVIRADRLIEEYEADIVLLVMFSDSENRCGYRVKWGMPKPYYTVDEGRLTLHDEFEARPKESDSNPLGRSALVDLAMRRVAPEWWLRNTEEAAVRADNDPAAVGAALMEHLTGWARSGRCRVLVAYQGDTGYQQDIEPKPPESWSTNRLTLVLQPSSYATATAEHAATLKADGFRYRDLCPDFEKLHAEDEERYCSYYNSHWGQHFTAKGNRRMARWLADLVDDTARKEAP